MKKLFLAVVAMFSTALSMQAQAPDFGFETWANVPLSTTIQDPTGWASFNVLGLVGTPQSVFKETTAPYAGTTSAKISTVKITGAAIPSPYTTGNLDTAGMLAIGGTSLTAPYIRYGKPYAWRPAALSFASKYTPVGGDSASVFVFLTHFNGTTTDTVATGTYVTGAATSSYAVNNITLSYNSATVMPDTEIVFISSSVVFHDGAQIGSTFYIDGLQWTGYNSTDDLNGKLTSVSIFPNPAGSEVNFKSSVDAEEMIITDITGRKVGTYTMNDNKLKVQTLNYAPGMYFYQLLDKDKKLVHKGKFEVSK